MNRLIACAVCLVVALAPTDLDAQGPRGTVSLLGGYSWESDLLPTSGDATAQPPASLAANWIAGLQGEFYFGTGLLGARLESMYARRQLTDGPGEYNLFTATLGLTIRPRLGPGLPIQPYAVLGAGASGYQSVLGSATFAEGVFGPDPVVRLHVTPAIGFDLPLTADLGLRLEVADRITLPAVGFSPPVNSGFPNSHAAVVTLGAQWRIGEANLRGMGSRRVVERPEPEPEPMEPEPEPEPEPVMEEEAEEPAPEPEPAADTGGFTVQIATWLTPGTARRWGAQLEDRGLPVWYFDRELGGTEVSRVRAGATATEAEAAEVAAYIQSQFGWGTEIIAIGADDPVPANAMTTTREFLEQQ